MAIYNIIPESDHVLRYASTKYLDVKDGKVIGFTPFAFEIDEEDRSLSCTWVEYCNDIVFEDKIKSAIKHTSKAITVKASGRFGLIPVEKLKSICSEHGRQVRVLHDPDDTVGRENPAHCLISGYYNEDRVLLDRLSRAAVTERFNLDAIRDIYEPLNPPS